MNEACGLPAAGRRAFRTPNASIARSTDFGLDPQTAAGELYSCVPWVAPPGGWREVSSRDLAEEWSYVARPEVGGVAWAWTRNRTRDLDGLGSVRFSR